MANGKSNDKTKQQKIRALLSHLGIDPSPLNVCKVKEQNDNFEFNNKIYQVLSLEETRDSVKSLLLNNPRVLPAPHLVPFLQGIFSEPYQVLNYNGMLHIAEALLKDSSTNSLHVIVSALKLDVFFNDHIDLVINEVGLDSLLFGAKQVTFKDKLFVIVPVRS